MPNPRKLPSETLQDPLLAEKLAAALPEIVIFPHDTSSFGKAINYYWAKQECEVVPCCVLQVRNTLELSIAVKILKREYDGKQNQYKDNDTGELFAVRGGGHSPNVGAATTKGGVLIDLSLLKDVKPTEDRLSVSIGGGAKWNDVSQVLDGMGLAVVGGRDSHVGVGGLTLGGGLSFFTPRFGMVCSNVISYEVVLASGSIINVSESEHSDLWRALKGGSNNFGIVTRFNVRSFDCRKIWAGLLFLPSFQSAKSIAAFHDCVEKAYSSAGDCHAPGPITSFTYVRPLGTTVISVSLVYTKPPESVNKWPVYWRNSPYRSLFRLWSTCKERTLTSATDEMHAFNGVGKRQLLATTTIKNDLKTLAAAHSAFQVAIGLCREVKGLNWTLVMQPLLPNWIRKGDPAPLGLDDYTDGALVNVHFAVNWQDSRDDVLIRMTARQGIEQIEAFAKDNITGHPYRFMNYCAEWQRPFESYGRDNWQFMKEVSMRYDPDGLFRKCCGGFKIFELHI